MKQITRMISLLLCAIMMAGIVPLSAFAAEDRAEDEDMIPWDTEIEGELTENNTKDYYKIVLEESGRLSISVTAYMTITDYYLLDENGTVISRSVDQWWRDGRFQTTWNHDLLAGTYYWGILHNRDYGRYCVTVHFESSKEDFREALNETNNNRTERASEIKFEKSYNGLIAANDHKDYYKMVLEESGRLTIDVTAYITITDYYLLDENGTVISRSVDQWWRDGWFQTKWSFDLLAGTYYWGILFNRDTGNYHFTAHFESSKEDFPEAVNGNNNNQTERASEIKFGKSYNGLIAANDHKDYYKIVLEESGRLTIDVTAYITITDYYLLDENGTVISRSVDQWWDGERFHAEWGFDLLAGTYYWGILFNRDTGNYHFSTAFTSSNESFPESLTNKLNTRESAPSISIGNNYVGQIAVNDSFDLYKLVITGTRTFTIKESGNNSADRYYLYNYADQMIWNDKRSGTLDSGIYYLRVEKSQDAVNYSFFLYTLGDLDNDGVVSPSDARTVLRMSVKLEPQVENTPAFAAADYNNNGLIEPDDARSILRVSVGLEP